MQARLPGVDDTLAFSIYICAGILHWQYFVETLTRCQGVFIEQSELLKKVSFPRTSLPLYVFLSSSINYFFLIVLFLGFLVIVGRLPGSGLLALFPLLFLQQSFAIGLGVFLGTLHVFFRDAGHILGTVLQFWFWLTPIVYPAEIVPESLRWIANLNPMTGLIQGYQGIFLYNSWPAWSSLLPITILSCVFLFLGYYSFVKLDQELVDEL
jgi:lipopolysaccharide transport system permease protein